LTQVRRPALGDAPVAARNARVKWLCSGQPVVVPKGTAKGPGGEIEEPVQPSTQFIYLGLKMIDSEISVANAMTSIKKALAMNSQIDDALAKHAEADSPAAAAMMELIKRYGDDDDRGSSDLDEDIRFAIEDDQARWSK
jgi:hypothetical protein